MNKGNMSLALSLVNTIVIVIALAIGINEFVIKEEKSSASQLENSFKLISELYSRGPLKEDYTHFDFSNFSLTEEMFKKSKIVDDIDDILGTYQRISFCIEIGKCDEALILEKACANALFDGEILQKSIVQEIERGGAFIDRERVFIFFDLLEKCLAQDREGKIMNHQTFLETYKNEIEYIKKFSALIEKAGNGN